MEKRLFMKIEIDSYILPSQNRIFLEMMQVKRVIKGSCKRDIMNQRKLKNIR